MKDRNQPTNQPTNRKEGNQELTASEYVAKRNEIKASAESAKKDSEALNKNEAQQERQQQHVADALKPKTPDKIESRKIEIVTSSPKTSDSGSGGTNKDGNKGK